MERLDQEYQATKKPYSVLIIDVDRFKFFNDKYGHLYGDEVLKYFASSINLDLEDEEFTLFRFGGDEFVIVFPGKASPEVTRLAHRLGKNIGTRLFLLKGNQFKMSFSGGVASFPVDGENHERVLDNADKALYISKKRGRARTTEFSRRRRVVDLLKLFMYAIAAAAVLVLIFFAARYVVERYLPMPKLTTSKKEAPQDTIYLKSHGILKGEIVHEYKDEIWLKMKLGKGEGLTVVKKADVEKIERAGKK